MASVTQSKPPGGRSHFSAASRREAITGYLFIAPYLITAAIFTFGLLAYAFSISFTDLSASYSLREPRFVGLDNYLRAFRDSDFLNSLANVFWYAVIVTSIQTCLAILLAVLLNARLRGLRFFRTALYAPSVASSVVLSLIFLWLFLPTGFINALFGLDINWLAEPTRLGDLIYRRLGIEDPSSIPLLLRGPSVAWTAIMIMNIFSTVPTFMVMFLAALQDIPGHLYEAAELDGATGPRAFWHITLPLLRPALALVVVLGTIGTFQVFDQVSILTQGGPLKTTQVPAYYIYQKTLGTATRAEAGYAAAMAFILAAIIILFTIIQRRYIEPAGEQR
ncbi:MAG TPA: sugar ABC transporter permease [Roseiflexaceae bacterium]|nr:sugar ABC transporter permease [Roseiflexaceae bacterium]